MQRGTLLSAAVLVIAMAGACSKDPEVTRLPVTGAVQATDKVMLVPAKKRNDTGDPRKPSDPSALQQLLAEGWGEFTRGPSDGIVERTPDGSPPPEPGANRHRIARFVHTTDFQLADDESPSRLAATDATAVISGAFRPQEGYGCRILDAVSRTINRIHATAPIDFVLLGGDNADNAQDNEVGWVVSILDGASTLKCDSGAPDDPVPGANNDGKDPFTPAGLDMPWYWVTGNHDVLVQGNLVADDAHDTISVGDTTTGGTRDYRKQGAPVVQGAVVPDPGRFLLRRPDLMKKLAAAQGRAGPRGHGIGAYAAKTGRAYYAFDVPGGPIRFLVMDTSAETGGADGLIRRGDVEQFIVPELERAKTEGKYVVLASHHASDTLGNGATFGGSLQPDAVSEEEWEGLVAKQHHVVLDMVGHAHAHRVRRLGPLPYGYWEVQSSAIADFPHQFRVVEIWDEDDGWLSIRSVAVDYDTENDPVAASGRQLGILDFTTGWASAAGPGTPPDRNVILWTRKP